MNDRDPSGAMTTPAPASDAASGHYATHGGQETQYGDFTTYDGYGATGLQTGTHTTAAFESDPLFGSLPGQDHTTGAYETTQWTTGGHQSGHYDPYTGQSHATYDSGAYDATAWTTGHQPLVGIPHQATSPDVSGQWDAGAWLQPDQSAAGADLTQQWEWGTQAFDTGAYDATQWNSDGTAAATDPEQRPESFEQPFDQQATATFEQLPYQEAAEEPVAEDGDPAATGELPTVAPLLDGQEEIVPASPRPGSRSAARSRRKSPPKRSALLTVAVPSVCVMGVAGIAAASVGSLTDDGGKDTTATASDAHAVKPSVANSKLDSQLRTLSAGADDFADRASRTQERIDLKAQQEAQKKKAIAEAARKERLRPKYVLPVTQKGLSAYFGQAGVNWMSVHTGIDFPVSYGTPVMAATDGTVTTKWNSAYGNMLILTAKDGTQTWYCHLSRYQVPSGTIVKAGQQIAYSGNSGNSTGPHLHFEVRPAGGAPIDPLPWLRSHGLDPT
ncbi:peptidoglycan DD-metalloendopeptidase family protein [Streptomyces sp. NPDC001843]|uniref:M23 family metallopeptidase n=1 Tax=Streptomyces sp. NPDC001843 TaxID=3364617 RepID=UPI0036AEED87